MSYILYKYFCEKHMTYSANPHFTVKQMQIIYGTLLGGSSIVRPRRGINCYLAMRNKNRVYLSYKVAELECFFKAEDNVIRSDKNTYRCFSISYPIFSEIYDQFYHNDKRIVKDDILNSLTHYSWMIWFLDCGKKFNKMARLRTTHLGMKSTKKIKEYFDSLDFPCDISNNHNQISLKFHQDVFEKYIGTFFSLVPSFMISSVV